MEVELVCEQCGIAFFRCEYVIKHARIFCGRACYHKTNSGAGHKDFRGGLWFEKSKGYMMRTLPGGHRAEHILIAEKALGRRLRAGEVVHHINGDKLDNRNTNLLICTRKYHTQLHALMSMKYAALLET